MQDLLIYYHIPQSHSTYIVIRPPPLFPKFWSYFLLLFSHFIIWPNLWWWFLCINNFVLLFLLNYIFFFNYYDNDNFHLVFLIFFPEPICDIIPPINIYYPTLYYFSSQNIVHTFYHILLIFFIPPKKTKFKYLITIFKKSKSK